MAPSPPAGDGGWGESCGSYWAERRHEVVASTPSQTAWALLGLMAAARSRRRGGARHRLSAARPAPGRQVGRGTRTTRSVFRASSTSVITATARTFRSGLWPATRTSWLERPPRRLGHVSPEEPSATVAADRRLQAEARLPRAVASASRAAAAAPSGRVRAERLIAEGAAALVSFRARGRSGAGATGGRTAPAWRSCAVPGRVVAVDQSGANACIPPRRPRSLTGAVAGRRARRGHGNRQARAARGVWRRGGGHGKPCPWRSRGEAGIPFLVLRALAGSGRSGRAAGGARGAAAGRRRIHRATFGGLLRQPRRPDRAVAPGAAERARAGALERGARRSTAGLCAIRRVIAPGERRTASTTTNAFQPCPAPPASA